MDKAKAIQNFWSGFGWETYDEATVPDVKLEPGIPRITYSVILSEFDSPVSTLVSLWDYGYSWSVLEAMVQRIYDHIGRGGVLVPYDGGAIWIRRGTPFAQRMGDEQDDVRRYVLSIEMEFLS